MKQKHFLITLEHNPYSFIIRTLGRLSDFEVTNCQPFLLLYSALNCTQVTLFDCKSTK